MRILLAALLVLVGCGGSGSPMGTAAGMGGGDATSSASTGGTGGQGGAAQAPDVEVGDFDCSAFETSIGPLNGEAVDSNGVPIIEEGAIALLRVKPPVLPWAATAVRYGLAIGGVCALGDHEVIAFTGPADADPPAHPVDAKVTPVAASNLTVGPKGATVDTTIAPVVVGVGQDLWIGVRLHIVPMGGGKRECAYACDDGLDVNSWFSAVNADAMVDLCPEDVCSLKEMQHSPDDAKAHQYHNDARRWPFVVTGHAM